MSTVKKLISVLTVTMITYLCAAAASPAEDFSKPDELVIKGEAIFKSFRVDPNMGWFRENLHRAKGIFIVPQMVRGGRFGQAEGAPDVDLVPGPVEIRPFPIVLPVVLVLGLEVVERQPHAGEELVRAVVDPQAGPGRQPRPLKEARGLQPVVEMEDVILQPATPLPIQQRVDRG